MRGKEGERKIYVKETHWLPPAPVLTLAGVLSLQPRYVPLTGIEPEPFSPWPMLYPWSQTS